MDVARLNFSHGTAEEHAETAQRVRDAANRAGRAGGDPAGPARAEAADRQARATGIAELKPGDEVTFVCGEHDDARATRGGCTSPGPGSPTRSSRDEVMYLADGAVRLRIDGARGPATARSTRWSRSAARSPSRQGLNIPGETAALPSVPEEDLEPPRDGREDRRRPRRALVRAPRRGHRDRAQAHAAAADRQDREAAGGRARRGDRARRRLRDGRARRPRHRDADRGGADRPEADHRAGRRARPPGDHRDADARLDGRLLAPDARRGDRRRQRDPRRHRRGDALPGDRRRRSTRSARSR